MLAVALLGTAGVASGTPGTTADVGASATTTETTALAGEHSPGDEDPGILAVYPDPVTDGDRGEFVLLRLPPGANRSAWTLADGDATVGLGNGTGGGRVAVADDPGLARNHTDAGVVVSAGLSLSNAGETLVLRRSGRVVDRLVYGDAREGHVYADGRWRPLGATDHPATNRSVDAVRPFLLPDAPEVPVEVLAGAEERILLAGYTFDSPRVTRALLTASDRGVAVTVLLEASPVGGRSRRAARLLDRLAAGGVDVRVLGGPRSRYAYHHAKYAVVDDRALVLSENWKPSGVGGRSNRGWGIVVPDREVAADLAAVFREDADAVDAIPWSEYRRGREFTPAEGPRANGTFAATPPPGRVDAERVELLVAPDNAETRVRALLRGADEEILVQQVSLGGPDGPFLSATLAAARRGVAVRILLSSAWYVREENRRLADHLRRIADREGLPLRVRLADPGDRYRRIHAKGVVVDGDTAVVGSLNWNDHAATENREVVVVIHGEAAGYYGDAVRADWSRGGDSAAGSNRLRFVALAGVVAVACAVLVARRVVFENGGTVGVGEGEP